MIGDVQFVDTFVVANNNNRKPEMKIILTTATEK